MSLKDDWILGKIKLVYVDADRVLACKQVATVGKNNF
jgi:hypothetical protein